jgi:hypothetical protein
MRATLYQHPSAAVQFTPPPSDPRDPPVREKYPVTQASIIDAQAKTIADLQAIVRSLARYVPLDPGVDRPLTNCLADGMLLPPSRVCNFCGRDNN